MKKAILLAGGAGTRLYPLTKIVCKQLLPIYDKPMICYPLATLMLGGLREVLIISTPKDVPMLQHYLGHGTQLGIRIDYAEQAKPEGIAQAFLIGAKFVGDSGASLILGDNIFYGKLDFYRDALAIERGACIFGYQVRDPERYGVVEFDSNGRAISLEEKPKQPKSSFAVPGLYVYDNQVVNLCRTLRPSARNELEITDLNLLYLKQNQLHVKLLSRGMAWLDTGTTTALLEAGNYIATIEHRQGLKIACLEEVALRMGFISQSDLEKIIDGLPKNEYRDYLRTVCDEGPGAGPEPVGHDHTASLSRDLDRIWNFSALQPFALLAQQMVGVSKQFRDRFRFHRVVIAADLTMSIHEHHSRAVHWKSLRIASVGHRKFETVMGKFVDRGFWSG